MARRRRVKTKKTSVIFFYYRCPLYKDIRASFLAYRGIDITREDTSSSMRSIMNGKTTDEWMSIAKHISACETKRKEFIQIIDLLHELENANI